MTFDHLSFWRLTASTSIQIMFYSTIHTYMISMILIDFNCCPFVWHLTQNYGNINLQYINAYLLIQFHELSVSTLHAPVAVLLSKVQKVATSVAPLSATKKLHRSSGTAHKLFMKACLRLETCRKSNHKQRETIKQWQKCFSDPSQEKYHDRENHVTPDCTMKWRFVNPFFKCRTYG